MSAARLVTKSFEIRVKKVLGWRFSTTIPIFLLDTIFEFKSLILAPEPLLSSYLMLLLGLFAEGLRGDDIEMSVRVDSYMLADIWIPLQKLSSIRVFSMVRSFLAIFIRLIPWL